MCRFSQVVQTLLVFALALPLGVVLAAERKAAPAARQVELFEGIRNGDLHVKLFAKNAKQAQILIENKTQQPVDVRLPEAFAGVPVLAQFGGGGGGGFGGGGGGGGGAFGNQGIGGGLGGQQGGGQGVFSIPPEKVRKLKVACVCLDHGRPDPNPRVPYEIKPIDEYVDRPAVIELVKAYGREGLDYASTQAAIWHLNNDLSWQFLAAKKNGRKNLFGAPESYFSGLELQAAMQLASAARAQAARQPRPEPASSASETYSPSLQ